jgi:uncharacterized protein
MSNKSADLLATLRGGRLIITIVLLIGLVAALGRGLTALYVEVLWQAQAGYLSVFWHRLAWEWGVRIVAGFAVAGLVFVNLRLASSTLSGLQIRRRFGNLEISEQLPKRYVTLAMTGAASLIGLWFGASITPGIGRQVLMAMSSGPWGLTEPVLGHDVGFYVFWYPVIASAVTYALIVAFLVFTLATAAYAATGAIAWVNGRLQTQPVARLHLGGILAAFFTILAGQLWLGRYDLLLGGNSDVQGIFGFADAQARMPALQTLSVISLAAGGATLWGAWKNRPLPLFAAFGGVMLGTILIGNLYPSLIQSFRVEPNELGRETPYIEYSLDFTRQAFGLHDMVLDSFAYDAAEPVDWAEAGRQFSGLPVWGSGASGPLLTTYEEVEARFGYYDFDGVSIDRYPTPDGAIPVAISVRQINARGIPDPNWQNLHLRERYVAGVGAVASVAGTRTPAGRPEMILRGLPPEFDAGATGVSSLDLERPAIYFGTRPQAEYAVVAPAGDQYLAPDSTVGVAGIDFPSGIPLRSGLRTALLAWRFGDVNLLFSSELTDDSRLIHRRRVVERASAIAPFLRFPEAAYPVVYEGRVVWMLEGFTGTLAFPLSADQEFGNVRRRVRYVRNSVKVTIDAVTGAIDFYRVPIDDPLADAYAEAYPGLFKPMTDMPAGLRAHLRYPRTLLDLQSTVLLQYHQETAATFHGQQDVWSKATELSSTPNPIPYDPEYGIYRLPGETESRFQLTTVFVPAARENLTAMMVARTDDMGVPETILTRIAVADEVLGPRQVEARVEQDPVISQQFSLWRNGGSEVWTGHLHVVPVGDRLLYMEPIFLAAEADAIPDLARFVVSDGSRVVMTETLAEAIAQLGGLGDLVARGLPEGAPTDETRDGPTSTAPEAWPAEALTLLERAEARARAGDWEGYGTALDQLRALLERIQGGG